MPDKEVSRAQPKAFTAWASVILDVAAKKKKIDNDSKSSTTQSNQAAS